MTNRHVAEHFAFGIGSTPEVRFKPGYSANMDLKQEFGIQDSYLLNITAPILVPDKWDIALLSVSNLPPSLIPLALAKNEPTPLPQRIITAIGYPTLTLNLS